MYKMTNIETLGTNYTVANTEGKVIKDIQIISHTEILEASLGPYTDSFDNMSAYLEKSIAMLEGNDEIDPNKIYWYSTEDEEVPLNDVIEHAVKYGYDVVILEHLEPVLH